MRKVKLAILLSAMGIVAACANTATNTATTTTTNTTANVNNNAAKTNTAASPASTASDELASGKELYDQNCAACHKEDGTGGKMTVDGKSMDVDDLTSDKIKKFTDEKITGYIVNGVIDEGMPAFKDKLTDEQIRQVVRYVRTGIQKMPAASQP